MAKKNSTDLTTADGTSIDLATPDTLGMMVRPVDKSFFSDAVKEGFSIERVVTLGEGMMLEGIFLGAGGTIDVNDPTTKTKRPLGTWRIKSFDGNMVAVLLTNAQLQTNFEKAIPGTPVKVVKLGKIQTRNGMTANDHIVAWGKPPETQLALSGT